MTDEVPFNGWEAPGQQQQPDLDALAALARALLEAVPPDLQARMVQALQELLQALRALIEWWIERLEHRSDAGGPTEVRDIPVL